MLHRIKYFPSRKNKYQHETVFDIRSQTDVYHEGNCRLIFKRNKTTNNTEMVLRANTEIQ